MPSELAEAAGCTLPHARSILARVRAWAPGQGPKRQTVPKAVRAAVEHEFSSTRPVVIDRVTDPGDGFVKYLFETADGLRFEAVRIPLQAPVDAPRFTVCLSSQVGCGMGCVFCATGRLGLTRNLSAAEMIGSFLAVRDEAPGRVTGAVFQGQGEPLQNYDAVIRAAGVLCDPTGGRIKAEAITISTVGLVGAITRYAQEDHPYRLIVSLTSAIQARRESLIPIAKRHDLPALAAAIRLLARRPRGRGRVRVAWVMIAGVNTGIDEVQALKRLLGDVPLIVNLIDVNDARDVRDGGFSPPNEGELAAFRDALGTLNIPIVRRYSGGKARHAACGMLASETS